MENLRDWERAGLSPDPASFDRPRECEGLGGRHRMAYAPDRDGPHRGRGPRNYRRPDDAIVDEANRALTHESHVDASEIDVRCDAGVLILEGHVEDRSAKRRAEDTVHDIDGVVDVQNRLAVDPSLFGRGDR